MKRRTFSWIVLSGALLVPAARLAQSAARISCVRGGLQRAVDLYIEAQTKGDTSGLPLAAAVGYVENMAVADIKQRFVDGKRADAHRVELRYYFRY